MKQTLYWLEPEEKWQSRGYANNIFLEIDYDTRTYKISKGMIYPKGRAEEIKVSLAGDINLFAGKLRREGFKET